MTVNRRVPGLEHRFVVTAVESTIFVVPVALVLIVPQFHLFLMLATLLLLFPLATFFAVPQDDFVLDFVRVES